MDPHAFLDTSLKVRQPRGIVERDHLPLTPALPPRLADLVLGPPPPAGQAQEVVHEALQPRGDGVGPGADVGGGEGLEAALVEEAAAVLLGLLEAAEPVAREVGPGVRVLLPLLEGRHGRVEEVAHGQDAEPRHEGVGEYDVEPLEVADEGDVDLQPGVHGYGVVEVFSLVDEAC